MAGCLTNGRWEVRLSDSPVVPLFHDDPRQASLCERTNEISGLEERGKYPLTLELLRMYRQTQCRAVVSARGPSRPDQGRGEMGPMSVTLE